MRKAVFLFPKHSNYDWQELVDSGINEVMIGLHPPAEKLANQARNLNFKIGVSITSFEDMCPLDPKSFHRLENLLHQALKLNPQTIWLDHFRFGGHWEDLKRNLPDDRHLPCQWCRDTDRVEELCKLASWVRSSIHREIELGYFAMPLYGHKTPELISEMGQDHQRLCKNFEEL